MENDYDKEQFEEITNIKVDIASMKSEMKHINAGLRNMRAEVKDMFNRLEKKITDSQDKLSSNTNIREASCDERFRILENTDRVLDEKVQKLEGLAIKWGAIFATLLSIANFVSPYIRDYITNRL